MLGWDLWGGGRCRVGGSVCRDVIVERRVVGRGDVGGWRRVGGWIGVWDVEGMDLV